MSIRNLSVEQLLEPDQMRNSPARKNGVFSTKNYFFVTKRLSQASVILVIGFVLSVIGAGLL